MNNYFHDFLSDTKKYFFTIIVGLTFLEIQPFDDIFRGFLFASLIVYSILFFIYNIKSFTISPLFYIMLSFYVTTTISYIVHKDILQTGFSHIQYLFLFLNASLIKKDDLEETFIPIAKWLTIYGLFLSLFPPIASELFKDSTFLHSLSNPLWQKMINSPLDLPNRYTSILNVNHISLILGCNCIFSVFLFFQSKKPSWKIVSVLNAIISMFFIVFAYASRGSMVLVASALTPFCLCILLFSPKEQTKRTVIIIIVTAFVLLIFLILFCIISEDFRFIILHKVLRIESISTATNRDIRQKLAIKGSLENPLFGVKASDYKDVIFRELNESWHPHNLYLDVWLSFGTPSFILFITIFIFSFYIFAKILFNREKNKENLDLYLLLSIFLGLVIQSLVDDCFFGGYYIKGLLFSLTFGILNSRFYQYRIDKRNQIAS